MEKHKNFINKKKKQPFNVFSKKGLTALAMAGVMIASPLTLTACSDGKDGIDGTRWESGLDYTEFADAKVGDFFIDTNDYILYRKAETKWEIVMRDYGKPGQDGTNGTNGDNGQKGADGVTWWTGTEVTTENTSISIVNAKNGDLYLNTDTYDIFKNDNGVWKWLCNIKGLQGNPGNDGNDGTNGATWLNGTVDPTATQGKDGDFYLNTSSWDMFKKIDGTWTKQGNIKGEQGEQGDKGDKGEDGTSVYVGYDGYIWQGSTKTEYKAQIDTTTTDANVWEDTISVADANAMGKYFEHEYVDLSTNTIALMQHYKQNSKMTIYGNATVTEIQVISENAGILYIGTAKVSDVVTARTNGTALSATTASYDLIAGVNTITFATPLSIAEDEALVLGGSGSTAKLYVAKNIPTDDEVGNFTLINGQANTNVICETGEYADTLAVKVKASVFYKYTPVFENFATECTSEDVSSGVYITYTPFKYQTSYDSNFSGKTITKFGAYCESNKANSGEQPYMTIYKIKTSTTSNFDTNAIEEIKIYFPSDSAKGSLVYADCNIVLAEDETIAFGKNDDTFVWRFKGVESGGNLTNKDGTDGTKAFLAFDIYVSSTEDFATHLAALNKKESALIDKTTDPEKIEALKTVLTGKNLSILGDSISTFDGYSNDSANANSTIGNNYVSYGTSGRDLTLSSVDDTWWKQAADMTGMNVLVNNSYGGSKVSDTSGSSQNALTRAQNLHDDTGDNKGTNPDIIAVYMGINDFINGVTSEDFTTAYDNMISKIRTTYGDNVKIFVFTLVTYGTVGDENTTLLAYNEAIKTIATKYSCVVVDYANSGVNSSNLSTYMQDSGLLHPNAQGMDVISDCFWNALYETYVTNATQT